MKKVDIEITGKFGSKFQEQFARDSLLGILKTWKIFVNNAHKKNDIVVKINGDSVSILDFFNWHKKIEL